MLISGSWVAPLALTPTCVIYIASTRNYKIWFHIQALQSWLLHLTFDVNLPFFFVRDRFFSLVACLHADLRLVNNLSKGIAIFHRLALTNDKINPI